MLVVVLVEMEVAEVSGSVRSNNSHVASGVLGDLEMM